MNEAAMGARRCVLDAAGPALAAGGKARIALVPDTPEVASLVRRLAMAVSCPSEAYKRICSSASITTYACLFGVQQAPPQCQVGWGVGGMGRVSGVWGRWVGQGGGGTGKGRAGRRARTTA